MNPAVIALFLSISLLGSTSSYAVETKSFILQVDFEGCAQENLDESSPECRDLLVRELNSVLWTRLITIDPIGVIPFRLVTGRSSFIVNGLRALDSSATEIQEAVEALEKAGFKSSGFFDNPEIGLP